ncbi:sec-independent protein translocase protein TatB [Sinosporangium album]|uniref:Sec-independent protein translocase protein TatB n=1 Tax=Sinosporangium album TaxID=504805 RepID=A0A1G7Y6R4_9ACTN|nr:sec-independent translocase [Sinosporangium album]SDG91966.1 sec-independent protein translocase protein TatB [Sinosporangium album]
MLNLGWWEIGALVVIALLVFGPEKLPEAAAQAGRGLRKLRRMATSAKSDLRSGLGPEFANFDPTDLNPKNFVRKHLLDDIEDEWRTTSTASAYDPSYTPSYALTGIDELDYGEVPPFDPEAT